MFSLEKNHQSARLGCLLAVLALTASTALPADKSSEAPVVQNATGGSALFWSDPGDITARDLFYGQGGKAREPHGPFQFDKEDLNGSNPSSWSTTVTASSGKSS